jgi:MtrB/PioB family decaheme-associated outer membrane protein
MKTTNRRFTASILTLALQSALVAMFATPTAVLAEGDENVAALTNPTNTVEIGVSNTSTDSAKFGEYNGLDKKGAHLIGNYSLKGGDAYGMGVGTTLWSVTGTDLGTDSREVGATFSNQGKWNFSFGKDQLTHNFTNTYNTPFNGQAGSNNFTLPGAWGTYASGTLSPGQLALLHDENVYSKRDNTSFNAGVHFNDQLGLVFDFKRIEQSGGKLISTSTDKDVFNGIVWKGEAVALMMNPTQSRTNNIDLALNWKGDKGHMTAGYFVSIYRDDYNGMSWQNGFYNGPIYTGGVAGPTTPTGAGYPTDTMSTPPSNEFHQLNLTGGYAFTPATRLAAGWSYARSTQNAGFDGTYTNTSSTGSTYSNGPASADFTAAMSHLDLKLTQQTTKDLNLSAGYKYNERDNRSASDQYSFYVLGDSIGVASAATGGASTPPVPVTVTNIPMSWKHTQYDLGAEYRINGDQHLHVSYNYDIMKRWCNNDAANLAAGYYSAGTSCVMVPENKENTVSLDYKVRLNDALSLKAGYSYADRKADVLDIANATFQNTAFYNPNVDIGGQEFTGFVASFQASRKENMLKLGANWQPADRLSIDFGAKIAKDDYGATYGVQNGSRYNVNLDANYAYSRNNSVDAFVTTQHRDRDLTNAYSAAVGTIVNGVATTAVQLVPWNNKLTENDMTVGLGAKQVSLIGGRLELAEDLTYSLAKTDYTTGFEWTNGNRDCSLAAGTTYCGTFPTIKTKLIVLKLAAGYNLDKVSKVVMGYQYQHLESEDATYYQYYQSGYKTNVIPTNQEAPNYNQNIVYVVYKYSL